MKFKILAVNSDSESKTFEYDNQTNIITLDGNVIGNDSISLLHKVARSFSPDEPLTKSNKVKKLKIQLGLSCNYSCEYCSQRFVERADETSFKDVDSFLKKLDNLEFSEELGLHVELWGGEPLVYWKTIVPLVAALKKRFSSWNSPATFSMISNGSILTDEMREWILDNLNGFAISHDGPGQHVRGPDPFDDPEQKKQMLALYNEVKTHTRFLKSMSFNSMLNAKNYSRKEIRQWFIEHTGDPDVLIGEGSLVDAYDEGGISLSLHTKKEHFEFRKLAFAEIYNNGKEQGFGWLNVVAKINQVINSLQKHVPASSLGQKCGMDDDNTMAVDLRGNVLTCQNVSAVAINANGKPHNSGNIENMEDVKVTTSTHWTKRDACSSCPVLHACKGSCMFVVDEYWEKSCNNAYSDNVVVFAIAFEALTGYIPIFIDAPGLPDMRKDVFGTQLNHIEEPVKQKRIIPIVGV
jgi:uncharacterized protein